MTPRASILEQAAKLAEACRALNTLTTRNVDKAHADWARAQEAATLYRDAVMPSKLLPILEALQQAAKAEEMKQLEIGPIDVEAYEKTKTVRVSSNIKCVTTTPLEPAPAPDEELNDDDLREDAEAMANDLVHRGLGAECLYEDGYVAGYRAKPGFIGAKVTREVMGAEIKRLRDALGRIASCDMPGNVEAALLVATARQALAEDAGGGTV